MANSLKLSERALGLRDQFFLRRHLGARATADGDGGAKLSDRELGERELVHRAVEILLYPDTEAADAQRPLRERHVLFRARDHLGDVLQVALERRGARLGRNVALYRLRELALDGLHLDGDGGAILDDAFHAVLGEAQEAHAGAKLVLAALQLRGLGVGGEDAGERNLR